MGEIHRHHPGRAQGGLILDPVQRRIEEHLEVKVLEEELVESVAPVGVEVDLEEFLGVGHLVEQDLQQQLLSDTRGRLPALGEPGCEVNRGDQEVPSEADVKVMRESWRQRTEDLKVLDGIGIDAIAKLNQFAEILEESINDRDRRSPQAAGKHPHLAARRCVNVWTRVVEHTKHLDVDPDQPVARLGQFALQLGIHAVPLGKINEAFRCQV